MIDFEIRNKDNCTGCHACFTICPENCITMNSDSEGFWYPQVDHEKCIECRSCIDVCPIMNMTVVDNKPKAYSCISKDESIRCQSSSGGMFTLIAQYVIDHGGVVFGAGFDDDFRVVHSYVENMEGIAKFRGSKYVQSEIGNTYSQAKDFLEQGRRVLFTGTPCQIGGLKSYLGKSYDNLLCADNICHGVPSPKVWEKYVLYRVKEATSKAQMISFRAKNEGWKRYSVSFSFENGIEYRETLEKDLYMRVFLKNVCLRPSCYACKFKSLCRESDITLGDFWGVHRMLPHMDDDKGTSLVFINSYNGQSVFEEIKESIEHEEVDVDEAVFYNPAAVKSVEYNPIRQRFFEELEQVDFDELVSLFCADRMVVRVKRTVKSFARAVLTRTGLMGVAKRVLRLGGL